MIIQHSWNAKSYTSEKVPLQIDDLYTPKRIQNPFNQPPIYHSPNKHPQNQHQTSQNMLCELTRIRAQYKLLYLKQCRQRKCTPYQLFANYPFTNTEYFHFDISKLRDQNGKLIATIIQNYYGIHLIYQSANKQSVNSKHKGYYFNGLGISLFNDGKIFEGYYHNNLFCDIGYLLSPTGNAYLGSFKYGMKTGHGTFYWFSHQYMYSGDWLCGLPHGYGIYLTQDRYEGCFSNGLKYGPGYYHFCNGDRYYGNMTIYLGYYVNSVADGYGYYYWQDGSNYKGDFKQGVRHGYGIWQDNYYIYKGNYRMDKKYGFGIYVWIGKQMYKGYFKNDFREGYGYFVMIKNGVEKVVYRGNWLQGCKQYNTEIDQTKVKKLQTFLSENTHIEAQLQYKSMNAPYPKARIGHRNCIPYSPPPPPR